MNPIINTSILVEAKKEYTKVISGMLAPLLIEGFEHIYDKCLKECEQTQNPEVLKSFQQTLRQIPKWNQDIIDDEYEHIANVDGCDILDDLVKAVFITNIKILSSVSGSRNPKKVMMTIPSTKRFIHKCFIECAREIYKDPFLFSHDIGTIEQLRNRKEVHNLVEDAIEEAIRLMVPVRQILEEYLGDALNDPDEDSLAQPTYGIIPPVSSMSNVNPPVFNAVNTSQAQAQTLAQTQTQSILPDNGETMSPKERRISVIKDAIRQLTPISRRTSSRRSSSRRTSSRKSSSRRSSPRLSITPNDEFDDDHKNSSEIFERRVSVDSSSLNSSRRRKKSNDDDRENDRDDDRDDDRETPKKHDIKSIIFGKPHKLREKAGGRKRSNDVIEMHENPLRKKSIEVSIQDKVSEIDEIDKVDKEYKTSKKIRLNKKTSEDYFKINNHIDNRKASHKKTKHLFFSDDESYNNSDNDDSRRRYSSMSRQYF